MSVSYFIFPFSQTLLISWGEKKKGREIFREMKKYMSSHYNFSLTTKGDHAITPFYVCFHDYFCSGTQGILLTNTQY